MNKLSLFAVIASLSLAAPALAQTPSDIRNGRSTVPSASSSEVKLDRHDSKSMNSDSMDSSKESTGHHHGKKHHGKHHGSSSKHHGKKHHHKKHSDAAATDTSSK